MVRGQIPPLQSVFFAKLGEMLKSNAQYAEIFTKRFKPNERQKQLFDICDFSEVPAESDGTQLPIHVQCYGPTGSSKSYGVYAYIIRQLLNFPGAQALFIRQKLGDLKKSAWKDVKKFLETYGIPYTKNETDFTIKLPNGSSIVMSSDLALTPSGSDKADSLGSTAYSFVVFEEADSIRFTAETDRIYQDTAATAEIRDPGLGRSIFVRKSGSMSTVVWNPWIDKAKRMPDFGDDEWPQMVCVESCNVQENAITLAPGERSVLRVEIDSVPLA